MAKFKLLSRMINSILGRPITGVPLLMAVAIFSFFGAFAQQSIHTSGGNATGSGGKVSFSVGQQHFSTYTSSSGSVAQGIQQISLYMSGNVTIVGKTDHRDIRVISKRTSPTVDYDTCFTDSTGNYAMSIDVGIVNVYFSKNCVVYADSLIGLNAYTTLVVPNHQLDTAPVIQMVAIADFCEGSHTIALNNATPAGGVYAGAGVSAAVLNTASLPTGLSKVKYSINYAPGCMAIDSVQFTINANPQISISSIAGQCQNGSAINLNNYLTPAGGVFNGAVTDDSLFNPQLYGAGNQQLSYSLTDANGCKDSLVFSVQVDAVPAVAIMPLVDTNFCASDNPLNLTALPAGGTFSGTGVLANAFNPQTAGPGSFDIVYTYTNATGCSNTETLAVVVTDNPIVTLGSQADICQNGNAQQLVNASPSGGSFSGNGVFGTNFYPQVAGVGSHTISYNYTDANGCSSTAQASIKVVQVPTASFSLPSTTCLGDTFQVNFNGSAGSSVIFSWNFDSPFYSSGTASGPYDIAYSTTGLKQITLSVSDSGCVSNSFAAYTNVLSSYAQIMAAGNTQVCHGDSVTLFANIGIGNQFQWHDANGNLVGDTLSYIEASQTGDYHCVVTSSNGCPSISDTIHVEIKGQIVASFTMPQSACLDDIVNINFNGTAPTGATYNWNFGQAIIANGSGAGPYGLLWNTDSTKTVSLQVNHDGCSSLPFSNDIYIHQTAANVTALGSTSVCQGETVTLSANVGPNTYSWFLNGNPLSLTSPMITANQGGYYSVLVTNTLTGCVNYSDSVLFTVNGTNFNMAFTANPTSFNIPPFNTTITNQTPNASNYYWYWSFGDGQSSTNTSPTHGYLYDGTYSVQAIAENIATGCRDTLLKTNYISCIGGSANPCQLNAGIGIIGSPTFCEGDSVKLYSKEHSTGVSYQWLKGGILLSGETDSVFYATQTGLYQVMISDASCSAFSQPKAITKHSTTIPVILTNGNIQPCTNDSMELYVNTAFNAYFWSNSATTASTYIHGSGSYTVTVTDNNGCHAASAPTVVNASYAPAPSICIVGVDSATNANRVIWERQVNSLLDSVNVYRESTVSGVYTLLTTMPYANAGIYIDTASNPAQQAYRYRLTGVDTCGMETAPSDIHKSVHLTINAGLNNTWNLIWTHYQGFNFGSYRIYRGIDSTQLQLLTQIQSSMNSYTDLNPPTGNLYYQIELVSPHGCYPDSLYAKANTNYNASRSNHANTNKAQNVGITTPVYSDASVDLYPNPNDGRFTVEIAGAKQGKHIMEITNNLGQLLHSEQIEVNGSSHRQEVNMNHLPKGIYYLIIRNEDDKLVRKLVVN